jgi:outer membrane protein, heavy metal efflux system
MPPRIIILAVTTVLAGCTTFDPGRDHVAIEKLLADRGAPSLGWEQNDQGEQETQAQQSVAAQPMTADLAVKTAMLRSPRLQQIYGELGLARADVLDAVQVANPRISLSSLALAGGPGSQFVFGVAEPLVDLLTLPAKARLARLDYERARYEVAASILGVSLDVEAAWYRYVGAQQVAEMRAAVADGLQVSADLAQRFYDAGNITELQLNREKAAASQARIEATRAAVAGKMARLELNNAIGLRGAEADWKSDTVLPLPLAHEDDVSELQRLAQSSSLELLAAQKGAVVAAGAARITRSFRLLGATTVGYDRERQVDRSVIRGPTLDIELPIFNQGGARVARTEARLRIARARLAQLALASGNAVGLGAERVRVLSEVVGLYRTALVPQREIVTRQSQLEQNFALIGEFEVLQAKAQEYEAYQGFLEAVRDYWLARVDLMRLVGNRLPSDAEARQNTPTVSEILTPPAAPAMDHSMHGGHHGGGAPPPAGPAPSGSPAPPPAMPGMVHDHVPTPDASPPPSPPPAPTPEHQHHGAGQ